MKPHTLFSGRRQNARLVHAPRQQMLSPRDVIVICWSATLCGCQVRRRGRESDGDSPGSGTFPAGCVQSLAHEKFHQGHRHRAGVPGQWRTEAGNRPGPKGRQRLAVHVMSVLVERGRVGAGSRPGPKGRQRLAVHVMLVLVERGRVGLAHRGQSGTCSQR